MPGASNVMVRKPVRYGSTRRQAASSPQMPFSSSNGGPSPRTSTRVRRPCTSRWEVRPIIGRWSIAAPRGAESPTGLRWGFLWRIPGSGYFSIVPGGRNIGGADVRDEFRVRGGDVGHPVQLRGAGRLLLELHQGAQRLLVRVQALVAGRLRRLDETLGQLTDLLRGLVARGGHLGGGFGAHVGTHGRSFRLSGTYVFAGAVAEHRIVLTADRGRLDHRAGPLRAPLRPVLPPRPGVPFGTGPPLLRIVRVFARRSGTTPSATAG